MRERVSKSKGGTRITSRPRPTISPPETRGPLHPLRFVPMALGVGFGREREAGERRERERQEVTSLSHSTISTKLCRGYVVKERGGSTCVHVPLALRGTRAQRAAARGADLPEGGRASVKTCKGVALKNRMASQGITVPLSALVQ